MTKIDENVRATWGGWEEITFSSNGAEIHISAEGVRALMALLQEGICALCGTEIPEGDELCCQCLQRVSARHRRCGCC